MDEQTTAEVKSVKSSVYDRIQCEKICPRSRWYFLTHEYLMWGLFVLSVLIGALAVSVTLFVVTQHQYALYEATHENYVTFLVDVLPYLWIGVFTVMALLAVYNLRHTKRGYRYPLSAIMGSSMVLSLAGGSALQLFGFGYTVDHMLGTQMRMYVSQEKMEERLWQNPAEGRLLGRIEVPEATSSVVLFTDADGEKWHIDISELTPHERVLLHHEEPVRIIGKILDEEMKEFHSCGAFPWMLNPSMSREELHAAREAFLMRLEGYKEQAEKVAKDVEQMAFGTSTPDEAETPCGQIAPVQRVDRERRDRMKDE